MLGFTFCLLGLSFICDSWFLIELMLFLLSFFFMFSCFSGSNLIYVSDFFYIDSLSYNLIILSFWVICLMVIASKKIKFSNNFSNLFCLCSVWLMVFLFLSFSVSNFLFFYVMFESSLIPTLLLILGWGYQPERIQAGVYMLFYTLAASLPLLLSILNFSYLSGSLNLMFVDKYYSYDLISFIMYLSCVFAFFVKLPMFMFHLWLPKAHVEAPVAGSMILAGVLLKLGGYGLYRLIPMFMYVNKKISFFFVGLSLYGGFLISLVCLMQVDMKSLIAYSSVAHMSLVLCGMLLFNNMSVSGSVVVMIGHGLCSSGLFCIANMSYERIGSRSLMISKGLMNLMPTLCMWWFLLSAGNMAAPPSLNLLGEIMLIISVGSWSKSTILYLALLSFFSASYSLYLFSMSQHGKYYSNLFSSCCGKVREYMTLGLHWVPLNILLLNSNILIC